MIEFSNVSKVYPDGTTALEDVSFTVPKGQFCVLLGHSGAGKSTLLRLVNGIVKETSGKVTVDGTQIKPQTLKKIRRKVSMIHQEFNLSNRSTVVRNVLTGVLTDTSFARSMIGWFPKKHLLKSYGLIERVGLQENHLKRRVSALSGGQQQRVGIARALMLDPLVILADEPVASLDPSASDEILSLLAGAARERNCTILCSLHQVEYAKKYADRIIGLSGGSVVFDLKSNEINQDALELIYENYKDPFGKKTMDEAKVDAQVDITLPRK